jgi:predicted esterase YcpF (UPF0227 family)
MNAIEKALWFIESHFASEITLERQHHAVITPELPADESNASATRYADVVTASISESEHPIVVGHSAAGWFLPLVPSRCRLRRMVFLAAVVPRIGMSFVEQLQAEPDMINPAWIGTRSTS